MPQIYEGTWRVSVRDTNAQRAKSRPLAPAPVTTSRSARSASPRATSNSPMRTARKNCRSAAACIVLTAAVRREATPRILTPVHIAHCALECTAPYVRRPQPHLTTGSCSPSWHSGIRVTLNDPLNCMNRRSVCGPLPRAACGGAPWGVVRVCSTMSQDRGYVSTPRGR